MSTKIRIIVDNIANEPYKSEHGYSVLIETNSQKILFDTAQGEAFLHNIDKMNIALDKIDYLVLSHGHYDHGGNISNVLSSNNDMIFVAHPNCTVPRYSIHEGKPVKSTALTQVNKKSIITRNHSKIKWSFNTTEVSDGVYVTGEIPRNSTFEDTGGPFYLDQDKKNPDLLPDDMALFIEEENELTLICGCCHSGLVNTMEHIKSVNSKPITTIIGGLHLLYATEERMNKTVDYLNSSEVKRVFPSHCTGEKQMIILKDKLNADVIIGKVGLEI